MSSRAGLRPSGSARAGQAERVSGGAGDDGVAEVFEGVRGPGRGGGVRAVTGEVGAAADFGAGLVDAAVAAEQGEGLGQSGVVGRRSESSSSSSRASAGSVDRRASRVGSVGMPSRRSVPGVLPVSSLVMSMMSSLSWKTTPISSPKSRQHLLHLRRGAGELGAEQGGGRDQRAGLVGDHLQVVVERVVSVAGPDGLGDLTLDQPGEGPRLEPDELRPEVGDDVGRPREQEVADQDRDRVAPAGVGAVGAAPQSRPRPSRRRDRGWPRGSARRPPPP